MLELVLTDDENTDALQTNVDDAKIEKLPRNQNNLIEDCVLSDKSCLLYSSQTVALEKIGRMKINHSVNSNNGNTALLVAAPLMRDAIKEVIDYFEDPEDGYFSDAAFERLKSAYKLATEGT